MKRLLFALLLLAAACTTATDEETPTPLATDVPPTSTTVSADPTSTEPPPTATQPPSTPTPPPATPVQPSPTPDLVASLPSCGDASPVSIVQTPVPTTPTPAPSTPTSAPATPTAEASPTQTPPTPTPFPAPAEDRVGFPEGYEETFKQFYVFDRIDAGSISYVCANDVAASVQEGEPFPYGSFLVFESWRPLVDENGELVRDNNDHLIRATLNAIFLMRKEQGFGEEYGERRSGEWEFVAFRPDGSYQTPPERSAGCAACHSVGAGERRDFVFRADRFFTEDHYGQTDPVEPGEIGISRMSFQPRSYEVTAGTTVTWRNSTIDDTPHTVTADDGSFNSGFMEPGATFSHAFDTAGTFQYICALHPEQMRATIEVK